MIYKQSLKFFFILLLSQAFAQAGNLRIEQAWARPNPPVVPNGAAYLTIHNDSTEDRTLLSAAGTIAQRIELHESVIQNNITTMRHRDQGIVIPAGTTLRLEPGGLHIMLMGLKHPLEQGQSFELILYFDGAETVAVNVTVSEEPSNGAVAN